MAYFPHAFHKCLVATGGGGTDPVVDGSASETSLDLTAGQIGVLEATGINLIDITSPATALGECQKLFYLIQGSYYSSDKLGKFHGGYTETVKSKGINPRYISDMYEVLPREPQNEIAEVNVTADCATIECNTTYYLRVDMKGSPALRTLQKFRSEGS